MTEPKDTAWSGPAVPLKDLLTEREAAKITGHSPATLAQYRVRRGKGNMQIGPDFVKVGKAVFYPRDAVTAYVERRG